VLRGMKESNPLRPGWSRCGHHGLSHRWETVPRAVGSPVVLSRAAGVSLPGRLRGHAEPDLHVRGTLARSPRGAPPATPLTGGRRSSFDSRGMFVPIGQSPLGCFMSGADGSRTRVRQSGTTRPSSSFFAVFVRRAKQGSTPALPRLSGASPVTCGFGQPIGAS